MNNVTKQSLLVTTKGFCLLLFSGHKITDSRTTINVLDMTCLQHVCVVLTQLKCLDMTCLQHVCVVLTQLKCLDMTCLQHVCVVLTQLKCLDMTCLQHVCQEKASNNSR